MIRDQLVMRAVSKILQRSERQEDLQKLLWTFVDVGILPQLDNKNNQILYGRRGTGKTHVLKVLSSRLKENNKNTVLYIDCRTLGSTTQFSDTTVPLTQRCLSLFRDILGEICNCLLEHVVDIPSSTADKALESLDKLASTITEPTKTYREESMTETHDREEVDKSSIKVAGDTFGKGSLSVDAGSKTREEQKITTSFRVQTEDKVIFPSLNRFLSEVLEHSNTYLYILLDEWSSLPFDIQPYLAEFLKRGVLPVSKAVLKIGSLEYRSRFFLGDTNSIIGFELGADISTAVDLDDYYVFDRNPEQITNAYADMLLRHLNSELTEDYLRKQYRVSTGQDFASRLFTERDTFKELARASEGVVRDLINIFSNAFFDSHRRERDSIDRRSVRDAARQWFEKDKSQYLDSQLQTILRRIVDEVIGNRRARSFLLPRELERSPVIQKLFDSRVLHHMQRGYADKDNPGIRYNIYTLDYGTYVDLIGTSRQPLVDLMETDSTPDVIVPFDDKRSIRRIVLTEKNIS